MTATPASTGRDMAEGIRIRPRPTLGFPPGAMVVVVDHARPFAPPVTGERLEDVQPVCSVCRVQHFAKTYHIQLRAGSAIVSTEVWENLCRLRTPSGDNDNPFELVNVVPNPPGQIIRPWDNKPVELIEKYAMPIRTN